MATWSPRPQHAQRATGSTATRCQRTLCPEQGLAFADLQPRAFKPELSGVVVCWHTSPERLLLLATRGPKGSPNIARIYNANFSAKASLRGLLTTRCAWQTKVFQIPFQANTEACKAEPSCVQVVLRRLGLLPYIRVCHVTELGCEP